jgi:serine/threonine protein kinase
MYSKIRKEGAFSEQRTKFYAAQVFLALREIHNMGYVYRDLKPENILMEDNGYIKITDFGLALTLKRG